MAPRPIRSDRAPEPGEAGFSVVEVMVALGIFAILAVGFAGAMAASLNAQLHSRLRTTADQLATRQVEQARALAYDEVGTVGGNPVGLLAPVTPVAVGTTTYLVQTTVQLVDDPVPGSFRTYADYKRVTVEVTRSGSATSLARIRTQIAPPTQPSLTKGVVTATVLAGGSTVAGVPVKLTGPNGFAASATTDSQGAAVFAGLKPTTGTATYQLSADPSTVPAGFRYFPDEQLASDTTSPLVASQNKTLVLRLARQSILHVDLTGSGGAAFTSASRVTITSSRGEMTSYAVTGGGIDVPLWWGATYQVGADADPGPAGVGTWWSAPPKPVTLDAIGTRGTTALTLTKWNTTTLTVDVGTANIAIRVKDGSKGVLLSGTSAANGRAVFNVPTSTAATPYTIEVDAQAQWAAKTASAPVQSAPYTATLTLVRAP